ncbi:transposase [Trichonephila clavipes]|nr:transposase [Trichonephila clavipes]
MQFWFRRFRSDIFDVKNAPLTGRPVIENVDKITEIIEVDRHELLPHGQTLNSDLFYKQLDRLKLAIDQKWPTEKRCSVPSERHATHVYSDSPETQELHWKVLMHPPYSPDLAPNDYHLFLVLQYFLSDKKLGSREDCENRLPEFFADKGQDFNERGNMKPPLKCQQIIQQNCRYLTQIGQSKTC